MLTSVSDSPIVILGLITILLSIVGCFMDNISATIILAPCCCPPFWNAVFPPCSSAS